MPHSHNRPQKKGVYPRVYFLRPRKNLFADLKKNLKSRSMAKLLEKHLLKVHPVLLPVIIGYFH